MRTSISTLAVMVASLLVKEAFAAPALALPRDYYLDTDEVIVAEEVFVNQMTDGSYSTGAPTAVSTTTIDGAAVLVADPVTSSTTPPAAPTTQLPSVPSSTPPIAPAAPVPEPTPISADAVFIEQKSISSSVEPVASPTSAPTVPAPPVFVPTTSPPAPVATIPPPPPPTVAPPTSSSGKRGLAYNAANLLSAFTSAPGVTWAYNWGANTPLIPSNFEYVPMLWGLRSDELGNWHDSVSTALAAGSTHLLAFNEPDLPAQSNIGYADAAAGYLTYMQPYAGKAKLVSPAITNGGGEMGLTWLTNFLSACSTCTIDKIALHWYNGGDAAAFKDHMAKAYAAGGNRPLWVTEFQASGSEEEQAAFLTDVMAWMDKTDYIERYAYFMVSDGNLIQGTTLSKLGNTYATS